MALDYRIDLARNLVFVTGEYDTATAWLLLLGQLRRELQAHPGLSVIRDLRGAERPPNSQVINGTFNVVKRFWGEVGIRRWAYVTDDSYEPVPMAIEALAEQNGLPIRIFTSIDEATAWAQEDAAT